MTEPKTYTLEAPGAVLHYDVRAGDDSTQPVLLIIGSPMGASGFGALAERFADRTVVTYDPRGSERSKRTDGALETTVDEHADDLHRLISALDAGPADIFASSGGAASGPGPARSCGRPGGERGYPPDVSAQRLRPGDGEVPHACQPGGTRPGRLCGPARSGSCRLRAACRGRRLA